MARAAAARQRLAGWLGEHPEVAAVVLTSPAAVAWATGAVAPPVDRTAAVDLVWVVATRSSTALVTTEVEADRVAEEYQPRQHGFADLAAVPWYDPDGFTRAAQDIAGAPAAELAADGHPGFGHDATDELCALRLALSPPSSRTCARSGPTRRTRCSRRWSTGGRASGTWTCRPGWPRCSKRAARTARC